MTITEEIVNLIKIKLVSGQHKVDIPRELKVIVRMVQSVTNGQRILKRFTQARVYEYKVDVFVKRAMKNISEEDSRVSTIKVCQFLPEKTSQSIILR